MAKETELIFIPVPSTGHILVTIEFAKRLITFDHRISTITILQFHSPTSPNASVFAKSLVASQPQISLHDLPVLDDPPPLDLFYRSSEAYNIQLVKRTTPLIKEAVSSIVASRSSGSVRVAGLVLDFFCNSLIKDVGDELNLPSYIFLTCHVRYLSVMKYISERNRSVSSKFDWSSRDEELEIPGFVNPIPTKFLPYGLFDGVGYETYVGELAPRFEDAKGILVNSVAEIDPYTFGYLSKQESYPPVYPVGPILCLEDRASSNEEEEGDRERIVTWLEDQPECSVVFLCFGSRGSVGELQVKEIAQALEVVGCRFLWAIRTSPVKIKPTDVLPEGFMVRTAGKGLVCGWAPQVEVLEHKAIGGFVSHCGWNSTLESLWFGVPVATWPMYAEQQLNAFTLVKDLGLAVDLRMDYVSSRGGLVSCEEIVRAVRSLMEGEEGKRVRVKVKEMRDAARKAVMDGGSSSLATTRFIDELVEDGSG